MPRAHEFGDLKYGDPQDAVIMTQVEYLEIKAHLRPHLWWGPQEEGCGTIQKKCRRDLQLTVPSVVPTVGHPMVPNHHQQCVILQTFHNSPGGQECVRG